MNVFHQRRDRLQEVARLSLPTSRFHRECVSSSPHRKLQDIDGEFVDAPGRTFVTYDPATGERLTDVAHGEAADIDRVSARRAVRSTRGRGPDG